MPQQLREGGVITVIYRRSESLGAQPGPLTPKFRASPEPKAFSWEHLSPSLHPPLGDCHLPWRQILVESP